MLTEVHRVLTELHHVVTEPSATGQRYVPERTEMKESDSFGARQEREGRQAKAS